MPLVDNSEFKHNDESLDYIVEVVVAILHVPEFRVIQPVVAAVQIGAIIDVVSREMDESFE